MNPKFVAEMVTRIADAVGKFPEMVTGIVSSGNDRRIKIQQSADNRLIQERHSVERENIAGFSTANNFASGALSYCQDLNANGMQRNKQAHEEIVALTALTERNLQQAEQTLYAYMAQAQVAQSPAIDNTGPTCFSNPSNTERN